MCGSVDWRGRWDDGRLQLTWISLGGHQGEVLNPPAFFSLQRTEGVDAESQSRWLENL
jgi:hypothetical protein